MIEILTTQRAWTEVKRQEVRPGLRKQFGSITMT